MLGLTATFLQMQNSGSSHAPMEIDGVQSFSPFSQTGSDLPPAQQLKGMVDALNSYALKVSKQIELMESQQASLN